MKTRVPEWERLLAHAAVLQTHVPGAVLAGGTAAALHAGHRISFENRAGRETGAPAL